MKVIRGVVFQESVIMRLEMGWILYIKGSNHFLMAMETPVCSIMVPVGEVEGVCDEK